MGKITIDKSKVIIDGHASDLETCNTLTNLCDELSKSDKFRTVRYENGYGEFESVRENEEKKFAGDPGTVQLYIKSNDGSTVLFNDIYSGGYVESTENGFSYWAGGQIMAYEYSGSKVFSGLANAPNSNVAKYPVGTGWMFSEYDGATDVTLYIVENIVLPDSYSTLTALFSDIATVIREKTGDTASIVADDFPDVIRSSLQVISPPAYLTFSSPSVFTLKVNDATKHWNGTLEYSTDTVTWSTWDGTTILYSALTPSKNVLYLRGTGNTVITGNSNDYRWVLTGTDIRCIGNIESLLDYATVESGKNPVMSTYCYYSMFSNCTALTQTPALPATTLTDYCYYGMFAKCTALTQAPALPATTLVDYCYAYMFNGCTSLTQAPDLPATTVSNRCYFYMFSNCTALTQAPALPATTLADYCYAYMFRVCTALTQIPALPATTLADHCYSFMFTKCTALTQIPALPATTLVKSCYGGMFANCTGIKVSSTNTEEYTQAYRIPKTGTGTTATSALSSMFTSTGGTFKGTPTINTTYYLSNTNTVVG